MAIRCGLMSGAPTDSQLVRLWEMGLKIVWASLLDHIAFISGHFQFGSARVFDRKGYVYCSEKKNHMCQGEML